MAIIYSYPEIPDVQGGDLLLISDTGAPNKPTRSVDIDDLAAYIGTVVGVVQNLQSVLTVGNTYVSPDGYGTFTLNDITNSGGQIKYVNTDEGWGYFLNAEEGLNFTDGSGGFDNGKSSFAPYAVWIGNGTHQAQISSNNLTASRIFQLPDASGTIALENLSNWYSVTGSRGLGNLLVKIGDYDNSGNGTFLSIDDADQSITFTKGGVVESKFVFTATQDRDYTFPNADGTIALTSDIPTPGPSGSGTTNYTARWIDTDTLGIGALYDNGTNVGIGTTSPAEKLHVNGEVRVDGNDGVATKKIRTSYFSSIQNLDLQTGSSADIILTTRNVGIGTTNPGSTLPTDSEAASKVLQLTGVSGSTGDTAVLLRSSDNSSGLDLWHNASTGDSYIDNRYNSNQGDTIFRVKTAGTPLEALRITGDGNVGIGTTSPSERLQVGNDSSIDNYIQIAKKDNSSAGIKISQNTSSRIGFLRVNLSENLELGTENTDKVSIFTNGTSRVCVDGQTGNVGIGTTSPSEKLHVEGDIRLLDELIFGEYSTTTDRITNQSYALTMAHSQSINFKVGAASVFNVYETQIRPQVNDTIDLGHDQFRWKRGFFDDNILTNGSIGIGNDYPSAPIHIEASDPRIKIIDTDGTNWESQVFTQGGALKLQARNGTNFGNISFQGDNGTTQSEYARFNSVGNFGIGTNSPSKKLDIAGDVKLTNSNSIYWRNAANNADIPLLNLSSNNTFNIGTTSSSVPVQMALHTAGSERMRITSSGNVGIGTTSPSEKLHVVGNTKIEGVVIVNSVNSSIYIGNSSTGQSSTSTGDRNVVIGPSAFTSNTSARYNTAVGHSAMQYTTTGDFNSVLGNQALLFNIDGSFNVAVGNQSLAFNTNSSNNTAVGYRALYQAQSRSNTGIGKEALGSLQSSTSSNDNTGIGQGVLNKITSGQRNVGVGFAAGQKYGGGNNNIVTANDSVFIGAYSDAGGDNQTNQIVIGYNAIGLGSNTVVLGNNSIATTQLKGNVGIGTTSPSEKLEVSGNIKVDKGAAAGRTAYLSDDGLYIGRESALGGGYPSSVIADSSNSNFLDINARSKINLKLNTSTVLTANDSGNVGIGITAPTTKLHVNGDIRIQGENELYFGGTGSVPNWEITASGSDLIVNDTGTNVGSVLFNNDEGVALPRLTTTEINAISLPAQGLMAYNTTLNTICFYNGSSWQKVSHANM
jgi:hypothetical protein